MRCVGGAGHTLAHSVRDRDRNASCTGAGMGSRGARQRRLVECSVANAAEISYCLNSINYFFYSNGAQYS